MSLQLTYTGQQPGEPPSSCRPGDSITLDVTLNEAGSDIATLQRFAVSGKEVITEEIATHEQRSAPNIKAVVSTDAFGDITAGNLGDFVFGLSDIALLAVRSAIAASQASVDRISLRHETSPLFLPAAIRPSSSHLSKMFEPHASTPFP